MVTRKEYTKEFKQEAVRLARESGNKSQVGRDLGIHSSMLNRWEKQFAEQGQKAFPGLCHVHPALVIPGDGGGVGQALYHLLYPDPSGSRTMGKSCEGLSCSDAI